MVALVTRPDLSQRTALSKSALQTFDLCQQKAWFSIHDPRPFVANEKVSFGSAVDAGVEVILTAARAGQTIEEARYMAAAEEIIARDDAGVSADEVGNALFMFGGAILPHVDWSFCRLQAHVNEDIAGLGEVDGHPDIILSTNAVRDVKTAARAKPSDPPLELGIYALLVEAETGKPVPDVGYYCWVRSQKPYWQAIDYPVTPEYRRWTTERVAAFVRAKKADEVLNRKAQVPQNFSMPGAPAFRSLCDECPWNPALGGPCQLAFRGETTDATA
jgi:hypothetical protein